MTFLRNSRFIAGIMATISAITAGCQSNKHVMTDTEPGQAVACSKCYDEIRKARRPGGPRGGLATNRRVRVHMCEDCKTEVTFYDESGTLMVKCPKCAPAGLPCDKCLPPSGAGEG